MISHLLSFKFIFYNYAPPFFAISKCIYVFRQIGNSIFFLYTVGMERYERQRAISLRPRLTAAADMLSGARSVADIGADHGRLALGLLQRNSAQHVIATDVSEASLQKARRLAKIIGLENKITFRVGDGLTPLADGEADAIALCGMGGMLMAEILERAKTPLCGAKRVVLQPMRGVEEIRRYLFEHRYRIMEDVIVLENRRYYQVFCAVPGEGDRLPLGWPEGCFLLGWHALQDPLFPALIAHMLRQFEARLQGAAGTRGEAALEKKCAQLRAINALVVKR